MVIEDYFNILYPNFNEMSDAEKKQAMRDKKIIADRIENLEYEIANGIDREKIVNAMAFYKSNDYIRQLYPDLKSLSDEEVNQMKYDKKFILDNISRIDEAIGRVETVEEKKGTSQQEILAKALNYAKRNVYFEILYPARDQMSLEEEYDMVDDRQFIFNHIKEMDNALRKIGPIGSENGKSEQEIMSEALKKAKSDLEKNNEQESSLAAKEDELSRLKAERDRIEAKIKALENDKSQNQGE